MKVVIQKVDEAVSTRSVAKLSQNKNVSTVTFRQTVAHSAAWITCAEDAREYFTVYDQKGECARQTDSKISQ